MSKKDKKGDKPKKKKNKSDEAAYTFVTIEENHALKMKRESLIQRIKNTSYLISDIEAKILQVKQEEEVLKEWQVYLSCDKLPKPYDPQNIRLFFEKIQYFEKLDVENTTNWMLSIDECSILSQDITVPNMTKAHLKESRIDFGNQYDLRINDAIETINRIEIFLKVPDKKYSDAKLNDIRMLKTFGQQQVNQYLDNLTYRILSSEAAYMEPVTITTAEYFFEGTHFDIHIWIFQNVPIYLNSDDPKPIEIELYQIKTNITLPFSVLVENMVIRGIHCKYDHMSPLTRYHEIPDHMQDGIEKSLKICLQKEFATLTRIQTQIKDKMISERAAYEESLRLKAEMEQQKAKEAANADQKKDKKGQKKKIDKNAIRRFSKEPVIVAPNEVPLVYKDFVSQDFNSYTEAIHKYHPNSLELTQGEVNLRHYQILGGVYHINSLTKPKSTNYPKLIMTWFAPKKQDKSKGPMINEDVPKWNEDFSQFFEITFEIDDCFCHWQEPIPCCFEYYPDELNSKQDQLLSSAKFLNIGTPIIINDFNINDLFTKPMMYDFIEHTIPRVISSFKFPADIDTVEQEREKKTKSVFGAPKVAEPHEKVEVEKEKPNNNMFSYEVQTHPERLFPFFKRVTPVMFIPPDVDEMNNNQEEHPYHNFSELISALEEIKASYKKAKFSDRFGNPMKIVTKQYDRSPHPTKFIAFDERDDISRMSLKSANISLHRISKVERKKSFAFRKSLSAIKELVAIDENEVEITEKLISKWSTSNILKSVFDANKRTMTIWTDRLGIFGLAFNRYLHFPFKSWVLQPYEENPHEIELTIESKYALFKIYITKDGYKAFITDFSKTIKSRKIYLDISEPINCLRTFKTRLQEKCLNIFPEEDAVWYVKGVFNQKHLAAELHTYDCISLNAMFLKFHSSRYNSLSSRRIMILDIEELKQIDLESSIIHITPEEVMFVEIKEKLTTIEPHTLELEYIPTWRNLEWYPDINQLIKSNFHATEDIHFKEANVVEIYLRHLLHSLRLFSYS